MIPGDGDQTEQVRGKRELIQIGDTRGFDLSVRHPAWLERLETATPWIEHWLGHQRRDGYWQHGSVCEDYTAIECPVYAVGGFTDGYTNAVPRLLAGLSVPRKGLVGIQSHGDPVDFRNIEIREL